MVEKSEPSARGPATFLRDFPPTQEAVHAFVESVTDYAIFLLDRHGTVVTWNAGAQLMEGYGAAEIIGNSYGIFYPPAEQARGSAASALARAAQIGRSEEQGWRVRKDGVRYWARVVLTALRADDGSVYGFGVIVRDLTEERRRDEALRRSEEKRQHLREQALRDPLTGALNRRSLIDFLRGVIERGGELGALLALDIDGFKGVNDQNGHDAGDEVLVRLAKLLGNQSRAGDRLFRTGGDEFLFYLRGVALDEARTIAERLRRAVAAAPILDGRPVTVSIGVAQLRAEDSAEAWIRRADLSMYEAKQQGRNRVA